MPIPATSLGRIGQPQDTASVVTFLASDDSYWLSSKQLYASGGMR
jgi:3-oxoacyl-[acyl-carrier protein] reductase